MSFRRWYLPLGIYSPFSHAPGPDWKSLCEMWDLTRPGVIVDDIPRPKCRECLDTVEAGASHASGESVAESDRRPSPLATPALVLGLLCLLVAAPVSAAPILAWDAVTTGTDGLPLASGLEVTEYHVYQCVSNLGSCALATATRVAVIPAPTTSLDLVGKTVPSAYLVTAANKAGESAGSAVLKVVPPDVPKNPRLP